MNKTQNTNVTTQTEEFDRSICMSFFNDHRLLVKRVERLHGLEMAYRVQNAIIDYGLDGIKPTEEELLQFIPEPVLNQIDNNQKRRAKSFKGEDLEVSRSIILLHRDRPEMSQNAIASELGVSKGKVNKTLQKYNNGEYEGIIDFTDTSNYTDTITSTSISTSNERDQRDHLTVHSIELANAQTTAATLPTKKEEEILTQIEEQKKKVIECHEKGMSFKKDNPQIQKITGLDGKQIYNIISAYEEEKKNKQQEIYYPDETKPAPMQGVETDFDMDIDFKSNIVPWKNDGSDLKRIIKVKVQEYLNNDYTRRETIFNEIVDDLCGHTYQCQRKPVETYLNGLLDAIGIISEQAS